MENLTHYDRFRAGDTFLLNFNHADYPAGDGYSLVYYLIGSSKKTITATNDGQNYQLLEASTSAWAAGNYTAIGTFSKAGKNYSVDFGQTTILPSVASLTTLDGRSHVKKVLDALESLIEGKAANDVVQYEIAGRSITKMSAADLIKWHSHYKGMYAAELRAEAISTGRLSPGIAVRF